MAPSPLAPCIYVLYKYIHLLLHLVHVCYL